MRFSLAAVLFVAVTSAAVAQQDDLIPPRSQQTHGRARSVANTAALTSLDVDNQAGVSDQLLDGEKLFVEHDGVWWYDSSDATTPNANRVDGGTFSGNFVREFLGKIHNVTTAQRTDAELISFPSGQSALLWDSTESKLYRADGNGFLVSPTFTEIVTGGAGSPLATEDEGVQIEADTTVIDFVGAGVTATQTAAGEIQVSIPGSAFSDFLVAGDTGPDQTIVDGEQLTIAGGEGIDTIASAVDTLTIDMAIDSLPANGSLTGNETVAIYNPTTLAHESILATSLPGGGGDTNFALDDLTLDADRVHDLNNFKVDITGNAITYLTLDSTLDESYLRAAGSHWGVNPDGVITFQGTGNDWKVEGSAGTAGQVITSNGPATPATWQDVGIAIEDEGAAEEPVAKKLNFVGAGVDATGVGGNEVTVTIPGGGGAALSNEDEGVEVDGAVVVQDFVGDGVTVTQTAAGEVEVNIPGGTANTLEYGEDLTAGDFIKIGADGKAYAVAATPIQSVDSFTFTDWESQTSTGVLDTNPAWRTVCRIDDNRFAVSYGVGAEYRLAVGDRGGIKTYTLGTDILTDNNTIYGSMKYCDENDHLICFGGYNGFGDFDKIHLYSVSGTTLSYVSEVTVPNRNQSDWKGGCDLMLLDGETDQYYCVWQKNAGDVYSAILDVSNPAAPSLGTEVNHGDLGTPASAELRIRRISGNRFIMCYPDQSGIAMDIAVMEADPVGGNHTMGPVTSFAGITSTFRFDAIMLTETRGVAVFRTGAGATTSVVNVFDIDPVTEIITEASRNTSATGTISWNSDSSPYLYRFSDDQFVLITGQNTTHTAQIINIVGDDTIQADIATGATHNADNLQTGPAGFWQGGTTFGYLSGDQNALSFVELTIESLANLDKLAGTAEQTLTAGNTGIVKYAGEISNTQSGLIPGEPYYLTNAVELTTTATDTRVGIAESATKLILDVDLSSASTTQNVTLGRTVFNPHGLSSGDLTPSALNHSYLVTSGNGDAITDFDYGDGVSPNIGHILYVYVQDGDSLVHGAGTIKLAGAVNFAPSGTDGTITLIYSGPTDGWRQHGAAMTY